MSSGIRDNQERGNLGDYLSDKILPGSKLSIVSAFFTIYAYDALREELEGVDSLRFLFGEPRFVLDPERADMKAFNIEDSELRLANRLQQKAIARDCADWLRAKAEIRSIKQANLLHGKMYHVQHPHGEDAIIGSSNLTVKGLGTDETRNIELNLIANDRRDISDLLSWFDEMWTSKHTEDVKQRVLDYLEQLYRETPPRFLYFLTLYHIFQEYLHEQARGGIFNEKLGFFDTDIWNKLYAFQKDAVRGAVNKILNHSGCIIADSVGLGKTFEALAVIKYFELMNSRVLVLCPKKLRDNWVKYRNNDTRNILARDRFRYDVLNHTDLSRESGLSGDIDLSTLNWGNYDLVVIDESHNFRNAGKGKTDDETGEYRPSRYERLMEQIIKSGIDTKVLLLSATPVNNTLRDLRNQIHIITAGADDALKESAGINNIGATLSVAQKTFAKWAAQKQKYRRVAQLMNALDSSFFKLLDEMTIARSRKHISDHYELSSIGKFPKRLEPPLSKAPAIDLEDCFPSYEKLDQEIRKYRLSLFNPSAYVLPEFLDQYDIKDVKGKSAFDDQGSREYFLIGMMKVNFLKRLESSIRSFEVSLKRTIDKINILEGKIQHFDENRQTFVDVFQQPDLFDEDDEDYAEFREQMEVGKKLKFKLEHLDIRAWIHDLEQDKDQLKSLYNNARAVTLERDAKLASLRETMESKLASPINDGNRKVLIFTAFADTAHYLYEGLLEWAKERDLHLAVVAGTGNNATTFIPHGFKGQLDFDAILTNFSPISKERQLMAGMPQDGEIDILIATDCISEGQNLQDCDFVINYDIHWNPVRIIQRFGRVDRLGSKNSFVQLVNFWPTEDLNHYIKLKERVETRMALLDLSATGEENILSDEQIRDLIEDELTYRDKQLLRLKDEILDLEEMDENISLTEFTLDDFRIELLNFLKENEKELEHAPLGLYAVVPPIGPSPDLPGLEQAGAFHSIIKPGVVFCLRQVDSERSTDSVNPLQPYFLVYIRDDGEIRYNFTAPKQILTILQLLCRDRQTAVQRLCDLFNQETTNGQDVSRYEDLLKRAVSAIVKRFEKRNMASLFKGRSGRLMNSSSRASGVEDFELISWLVIKG